MIDQLTVLLENSKGRLTSLCRVLGDAGIQMHSLSLADTSEFGVVRIICDNPLVAVDIVTNAGFTANLTKVIAVQIPDTPGGLAEILAILDSSNISIEYCYCFASSSKSAVLACKVDNTALAALENAGCNVLHPVDLYKTA